MIHVRPAAPFDAGAMAALLAEIIAAGGTTALAGPVTGDDLRDWMAEPGTLWHVAEEGGDVAGFQWIGPHPAEGACDIATFVDRRRHGLGTGGRLFEITARAARAAGHAWINATIRADNAGGLAFYRSRGFEPYDRETGHTLADGRTVDRVRMRYELSSASRR